MKKENLIHQKEILIIDALVEHYNLELCAANLFYQIASVVNVWGYDYLSLFFIEEAKDKQKAHMLRLLDYFLKQNLTLKISSTSIPKPISSNSLIEVVKQALDMGDVLRLHSQKSCDLALKYHDYETYERMMWFVRDEYEDYKEISDIYDYIQSQNCSLLTLETLIARKLQKTKKKIY